MPPINRNISIDILKFIAVFLIINSHCDKMYAHFNSLATGGAFGDALFFFCSGFTLFLGRLGRFDNWYKRRISRIYPSVFGWAIVSSFLFCGTSSMKTVILHGGGWFISAIMVYYVILYFIRCFLSNRLWLALAISFLLTLAWYAIFFEKKDMHNIYKEGLYYIYFIFMLQGAMIGIKGKPKCRPLVDTAMLLLCIVLWYGWQFMGESILTFSQFQILTLIPLLGVTYYMYKLANTEALARLYNNKVCHWVIMAISGLCLEAYLCQFTLITNKLNFLFPLNLLIIFAYILVMAYIVRCIGRWLVQTFRKEDYDWREIVKL